MIRRRRRAFRVLEVLFQPRLDRGHFVGLVLTAAPQTTAAAVLTVPPMTGGAVESSATCGVVAGIYALEDGRNAIIFVSKGKKS